MKISEYTRVDNVAETDLMVFERPGSGTKSVEVGKLFKRSDLETILSSPINRRLIYRGQSLGTSVSDAQIQAIRSGNFNDLFLGDFWEINGVNWRIADFNYWRNVGATSNDSKHVVIVPDNIIGNNVAWHSNAIINEVGYANSSINDYINNTTKAIIEQAFPNLLVSHYELNTSRINKTGVDNSYKTQALDVDLMNEYMVFGSSTATPASLPSYEQMDGKTIPAKSYYSTLQLALFMINPNLINIGKNWWLKDIQLAPQQGGAKALSISNAGRAFGLVVTSTNSGIRPVFAIG